VLICATAQRSGEPAWHRRQRRARAQARVLVRVASAQSLLAAHHSAQRRTVPSVSYSPTSNTSMANGSTYAPAGASRLVPGAPRFPLWGCGKCGGDGNWGDRSSCRFCHAEAPFTVRRRQREAQEGKQEGTQGMGVDTTAALGKQSPRRRMATTATAAAAGAMQLGTGVNPSIVHTPTPRARAKGMRVAQWPSSWPSSRGPMRLG
jgi:hypothetical protein